jgi:Spy/CpxP family protein refolding chaperone
MSTSTTRNRNLLFIIGALLLTNIAVLAYFLWIKSPDDSKKPPSRGNGGMTDKLKDSVGFNDQQLAEYKKLKDEQWNTVKPMFDGMRKAKDSLFRLLSDPAVNDSVVNKASNAIAERQKALDLQTFNHFRKVRALCTPEQQIKYDTLVQRMFRKMSKPPARRNDQDKKDQSKTVK